MESVGSSIEQARAGQLDRVDFWGRMHAVAYDGLDNFNDEPCFSELLDAIPQSILTNSLENKRFWLRAWANEQISEAEARWFDSGDDGRWSEDQRRLLIGYSRVYRRLGLLSVEDSNQFGIESERNPYFIDRYPVRDTMRWRPAED